MRCSAVLAWGCGGADASRHAYPAQIVFLELLRAALKAAVLVRSRSGVLLNGGRVVPPVPPPSALAEPGAQDEEGPGDEADALMNMLGGKAGEDEGSDVPSRPQRWWKGSRSGTKLPLPLSTCYVVRWLLPR